MGHGHRHHRDHDRAARLPVRVERPGRGKDLMGARWYNPGAGDFTSADTVAGAPVPGPGRGQPVRLRRRRTRWTCTDPTGHYIVPGASAPGPRRRAHSGPGHVQRRPYTAQIVPQRSARTAAAKAATAADRAAAARCSAARPRTRQTAASAARQRPAGAKATPQNSRRRRHASKAAIEGRRDRQQAARRPIQARRAPAASGR